MFNRLKSAGNGKANGSKGKAIAAGTSTTARDNHNRKVDRSITELFEACKPIPTELEEEKDPRRWAQPEIRKQMEPSKETFKGLEKVVEEHVKQTNGDATKGSATDSTTNNSTDSRAGPVQPAMGWNSKGWEGNNNGPSEESVTDAVVSGETDDLSSGIDPLTFELAIAYSKVQLRTARTFVAGAKELVEAKARIVELENLNKEYQTKIEKLEMTLADIGVHASRHFKEPG